MEAPIGQATVVCYSLWKMLSVITKCASVGTDTVTNIPLESSSTVRLTPRCDYICSCLCLWKTVCVGRKKLQVSVTCSCEYGRRINVPIGSTCVECVASLFPVLDVYLYQQSRRGYCSLKRKHKSIGSHTWKKWYKEVRKNISWRLLDYSFSISYTALVWYS